MDGFTPDTGVIFIAATNRADLLDPALLRPGRFDRKVTVRVPNEAARLQALRIHSRKTALDADVDLQAWARDVAGFSGAEIANLVRAPSCTPIQHATVTLSLVLYTNYTNTILCCGAMRICECFMV